MRQVLVMILLLSTGGCAFLGISEEPGLALTVHGTSHAAGDEVALTLRNRSLRTYTVHPKLCFAQIQRQENDIWERHESERVCTSLGYQLDPGRKVEAMRELPDDLKPGRYRFTYEVTTRQEGDGYHKRSHIDIYTETFQIVE